MNNWRLNASHKITCSLQSMTGKGCALRQNAPTSDALILTTSICGQITQSSPSSRNSPWCFLPFLPHWKKHDDDKPWLTKRCYLCPSDIHQGEVGQREMVSHRTRPTRLVTRNYVNQDVQARGVRTLFEPKYRHGDIPYGSWIQDRNANEPAVSSCYTVWKLIQDPYITVIWPLHPSCIRAGWQQGVWYMDSRNVTPNTVTLSELSSCEICVSLQVCKLWLEICGSSHQSVSDRAGKIQTMIPPITTAFGIHQQGVVVISWSLCHTRALTGLVNTAVWLCQCVAMLIHSVWLNPLS